MTLNNRYDYLLYYDVTMGNPNGDPDAGNLPRLDPETGHGYVTDVCLKRKARNYVAAIKNGQAGYDIYIRDGVVLNDLNEEGRKAVEGASGKKRDTELAAAAWMCAKYYDVRTWGAVMSTGNKSCGKVCGPVQLTFGRSVDPIVPMDVCITRMAVTNANDEHKQQTMGRKFVVPYALYCTQGFVSPHLADKTGFSETDLQLLWEAFLNMYDFDRSAARGNMAMRKIIIFRHDSRYGNAHSNNLFELVKARKVIDGPARQFSDYAITIDNDNCPEHVQIITYDDKSVFAPSVSA